MVAKRKKGRPRAVAPKSGERVPLGLRVTANLKRNLDRAAERSGRSQSQEAEMRLERSFERDSQIEATWGSREIHAIAGLLGAVMYDALLPHLKANPSARLLQNPAAFGDASAAIAQILVGMRPKNTETDVAISERLHEAVAILAPGAASGIIAEIIQDPSSVDIRDIKRALGHEETKNVEDDE
jgi:hypothetical protein